MNLSVISSPTPRCSTRRLVVEHRLVDPVGVEPAALEDLPPVEGRAERTAGHREGLEVDLAERTAVGRVTEEEQEVGPPGALDLGERRDLVEVEILGEEVPALGDGGVARRRRREEALVRGVGAGAAAAATAMAAPPAKPISNEARPQPEQSPSKVGSGACPDRADREVLAGGRPVRGVTERAHTSRTTSGPNSSLCTYSARPTIQRRRGGRRLDTWRGASPPRPGGRR